VRITLSEPGATGYVWSAATGLEPVMDAAEPTVSVSVSADATAGAVGGAVERVFRFRARRRGDVRIVLRLAPAWGDAPVRTRTVDVQVRTRHPETGP
jgi:predicted secreted protein